MFEWLPTSKWLTWLSSICRSTAIFFTSGIDARVSSVTHWLQLWWLCRHYKFPSHILTKSLLQHHCVKHWNVPNTSLTLSQCTLAGPVYTGMPLECHCMIQCTLGYHWATQRTFAGYTGTPLEKLSWNSPHWNATGETLTFAAYTGTPLEGLWQPTQAPIHIVKHAE